MTVRFTLNGREVSSEGSGARRLLDVLREELRQTGTKEGCGEGECGACSVLIDGEVVDSCLVAVGQVEGRRVVTIEGLQSPLQQAFIEHGAAQCGICTPGRCPSRTRWACSAPFGGPVVPDVKIMSAGSSGPVGMQPVT